VNCGHPSDIHCNHCPRPERTARQKKIDRLEAVALGLSLYGKTAEDREEHARVCEQIRALHREGADQ
jgi:hypothetical protein